VCILLILFVGRSLGQETKLKWFGHAASGETLTFQGSRIR
jgi:hypothetical protein